MAPLQPLPVQIIIMSDGKDFDSKTSLEELQQEHNANPFNMSVISRLAQGYANRGDYNSACQLYEKLVRLDEDNGLAWIALGHCYLLKAEYQKCFSAYQKALYKLPNTRDPQLWYGIGLLYTKFETYEYAEPAFQAVLRIDPEFEQKNEVLYKLGHIYKKTGDLENAITYLRNSMVGQNIPISRKVDALCNIGTCYEKQGKHDSAVEIYKEAAELNTSNFKTLEYLGWCLFDHDDEAGLDYLKRALENVGENSAEEGDLHYLLGRYYLKQQNYSESQSEFQKAIFKNPNSYIYWTSIGVLYAKALQPHDAFECMVKASTIAQERPEVWTNMGVLYEQCKQREEALLSYQRVLNYDPNNEAVARRKEELSRGGEATSPPLEYVHPAIEISEVPFSIFKAEKVNKNVKHLPDIEAQIKEETGIPDLPEGKGEDVRETTTAAVVASHAPVSSVRPTAPTMMQSESQLPPVSQQAPPAPAIVKSEPKLLPQPAPPAPAPMPQPVRAAPEPKPHPAPQPPPQHQYVQQAPPPNIASSPVFKVVSESKQMAHAAKSPQAPQAMHPSMPAAPAPPQPQHPQMQPSGPMQNMGFMPSMGQMGMGGMQGYPQMGGMPVVNAMGGMHPMAGMQMQPMPGMGGMQQQMGSGMGMGQMGGMPFMGSPMQGMGAMGPQMQPGMQNPMHGGMGGQMQQGMGNPMQGQMGNPMQAGQGGLPQPGMGMMGQMPHLMNPMQMYGGMPMNPMMFMYNPMMAAYMQSMKMAKQGMMAQQKEKDEGEEEQDAGKKRSGDALPDSRTKRGRM